MTITAARPNATGTPGYSETLPCERKSARRARQLVAATLNIWGLGDLADTGTLIVSELVANVIDHTRCRLVRVAVRRPADNLVRVAVADKCRAVPQLHGSGDHSEVGRGLLLVDALSYRWATTSTARARSSGRSCASRLRSPSGEVVEEYPEHRLTVPVRG